MEKSLQFSVKPSFFHSQEWITLLQSVYGYQHFEVGSQGFKMPLLRVRPLFGDRLISIPFSDYGGPVGTVDPHTLHDEALRLLRNTDCDYIEVRTSDVALSQALRSQDFRLASTYVSRQVEAHPDLDAEDLWKQCLDKKARQGVQKALKAGIDVTEAKTEDDIMRAYTVYFKCVKTMGSPCHPKSFFLTLKRSLGGHAKIYLATCGSRDVGMAVYLAGQDTLHLWARYSLEEYRNQGAVYLLDWTGIKLANTLRLKKFDFGRTRRNSGVELYKHHWRGENSEIHHLHLSSKKWATPPDPAQPKFRFYSAIWRILPDPLLSYLGPRVIRCIAL
jgi:hypothetical protein